MWPAVWWLAVSSGAELSGDATGEEVAPCRPQPPMPATTTAAATAAVARIRRGRLPRPRPDRPLPGWRPAQPALIQPASLQPASLRPKRRAGLSGRAGAGAGAGVPRPSRSITRVSKPAGGSMAGSSPTSSSPVTVSRRTFSRHASHRSRWASARARSRPVRTPSASSAATSPNSAQLMSLTSLITHLLVEISGAQFLHAVPDPCFRGAQRNALGLGDLAGGQAVDTSHGYGASLRRRQAAELAGQPRGPG